MDLMQTPYNIIRSGSIRSQPEPGLLKGLVLSCPFKITCSLFFKMPTK